MHHHRLPWCSWMSNKQIQETHRRRSTQQGGSRSTYVGDRNSSSPPSWDIASAATYAVGQWPADRWRYYDLLSTTGRIRRRRAPGDRDRVAGAAIGLSPGHGRRNRFTGVRRRKWRHGDEGNGNAAVRRAALLALAGQSGGGSPPLASEDCRECGMVYRERLVVECQWDEKILEGTGNPTYFLLGFLIWNIYCLGIRPNKPTS